MRNFLRGTDGLPNARKTLFHLVIFDSMTYLPANLPGDPRTLYLTVGQNRT